MAKPKTIPRRWIDNYSDAIDAISKQAQEQAAPAIAKVPLANLETARTVLIGLMDAMCATYTDSAAVIAAKFYGICRKHCIGGDFEPIADSQRKPEGTKIAVLGIVNDYERNGNAESLVTQLLERIDYEIKRAAADCTFANMAIDPYGGE